jgi:hypothetical protein
MGDSSSTQVEWPGAQLEFSNNSGVIFISAHWPISKACTAVLVPVRASREIFGRKMFDDSRSCLWARSKIFSLLQFAICGTEHNLI